MDRTISLNDKWYFSEAIKAPTPFFALMKAKSELPLSSEKTAFTLSKKIICPKQVNDTVTVYFTGNFKDITLYAGKTALTPAAFQGTSPVFDITSALKTGKVRITAHIYGGGADGFYLSVKRNKKNN